MNKIKRILSMLLTVSMLATVLPLTVFADSVPSEWAISEVALAEEANLVTEKIKEDYQKEITREEFCELVVKLFTAITNINPEVVSTNFTDIVNEEVSKAYGLGIVYGFSETEFAPYKNITRQEICTMLVRCIDKAIADAHVNDYPGFAEINSKYADATQVADWALPSVSYAIDNEIIKGVYTGQNNTLICPLDNTTREQAVLMIWRVFDNRENLIDTSSSTTPEISATPVSDKDGDDLSDEDETNKYNTDPELADTDGDGADDGWEIYYGTDPNVPNNSFTQTKTTGEVSETTPLVASATVEVDGEQVGSLEVVPVSVADEYLLSPTIPGYLGEAYDFSIDGDFDTAEISFMYDTSLGTISDEFQPRIYYFNEENGTLEELPNQRVTDGCVTVNVSHFSKYILLNSVEFSLVWATDIRKPSEKDPDTGEDIISGNLDIVFVIDESSSMESNKNGANNDPDRIRVDATKKFIDAMSDDDRASIVGFSESNDLRKLSELTYDKDVLKTQADNIVGNSGGTALYAGLNMAIDELWNNGRHDAEKMIIALTDGEDDPAAPEGEYDAMLDHAAGITIYTVGIGENIDKILLTDIAEQTGGKYFHATTADDVYQGFKLVKDETVDYKKDSNGDGISDYYSQLIREGKLLMSNGSQEFIGTDLGVCEDLNNDGEITSDEIASSDIDGDGLLNGEEIVIIELNGQVMARMYSDPVMPDTDIDGINDIDDKHPLYSDYFSDNTSDFRTLTDDALYEYSKEAAEFSEDFGKMLGDATVTTLSFNDMQSEYTEEMANFFIETANESYVNKIAQSEIEEIMQGMTQESIADYIDDGVGYISIFNNSVGAINNVDKELLNPDYYKKLGELNQQLTDVGQEIKIAKQMQYDAFKAGRTSADGVAGYDYWFKELVNKSNQRKAIKGEISTVKMTKKGFSESTIKKISKYGDTVGKVIDGAVLAYNTYELISDEIKIWDIAQGIANNNAQNEIFKQNEDLFVYLCNNGEREFTRSAARFVLESMYQGYAEVAIQMLGKLGTAGFGIALDFALMTVSAPATVIIGVALVVYNVCDSIFGWSEDALTRARVICLNDITQASIHFVNKYYLYDDASKVVKTNTRQTLGRHLENLVNLRIKGELKYIELYEDKADYVSNIQHAKDNTIEVKNLANKMQLFVVE